MKLQGFPGMNVADSWEKVIQLSRYLEELKKPDWLRPSIFLILVAARLTIRLLQTDSLPKPLNFLVDLVMQLGSFMECG